jgi:hypothetical protein
VSAAPDDQDDEERPEPDDHVTSTRTQAGAAQPGLSVNVTPSLWCSGGRDSRAIGLTAIYESPAGVRNYLRT